MALKLDRLTPDAPVADQRGVATSWFSNLWQRTMQAIEGQINSLVSVLNGTTPFTGLNVNGVTVTTLGNAATRDVGTTAGTVAAGDDSRIVHPPFGFGFDKDLAASTPSQPFLEFVTEIPYTLAAGLSTSIVKLSAAGTPPTATTVFDLQIGGVSVGSITFAAASFIATLSMAASHAVTAATTVQIVAPAALNGMTGRLYGSIVGVR